MEAREEVQPHHHPPFIFWAGLLALVVVAVTISYQITSQFPLGADEGLYITWGRLLATGYQPYTEVYLTNPPLSPLFLQLVWEFGASVSAIKLTLLMFWAMGLVAIALLAYEITSDWRAGLGAALFLGFSVQYFAESQVILMHLLSILPAIIALWLAFIYQRTGRELVLVGSAILTAISLEIKLLSPFLPLLVFGVVLSRHVLLHQLISILRQTDLRQAVIRMVLIWGGALMVLPILSLIFWDSNSMVYSAVLQRLSARDAYPPGEGEHSFSRLFKRLIVYVTTHRTLITFGLLGVGVSLYYKKRGGWLALAWLFFAAAMLSFHNPLYLKHFALLSAPLALAASFLFTLISWHTSGRVILGLVLVGLFGVGAEFAGQLPAWQALAQSADPPIEQTPAIEFIQEVTTSQDCLITDYSQLLLWTSRLPPPELSEVSSSRLRSGFLTTSELQQITETYDCPVVAPLTGRFRRSTLDYIKWVEERYLGLLVYTEDKQVLYFGKPIAEQKVSERAELHHVRFGPSKAQLEIELMGYEALPSPVQPGESIPVKLYWRPTTLLTRDYTVFIQFRNLDGVTMANADHQPYKGLLPFTRWVNDEVMPETTWLHLPHDLPEGNYTIFVGLYNQTNGERLPILFDSSGEQAVILPTITVQQAD